MRTYGLLLSLLTLIPVAVTAADETENGATPRRAVIVRQIDQRIGARWAEAGVEPALMADDEEFLRRVFLDLCGVIPRVSEAREFGSSAASGKRERLIEQLLVSPLHPTHLASTWRNIMLPGGIDLEQVQNAAGVQNWLRAQFAENVRYDRLVSDLLVATSGSDVGPALFYTSHELQPEKLAAATARIFLGLQIECAQCHNHPFDHWKQADFWGYAAFFARIRQARGTRQMARVRLEDISTGEVRLPNTEAVIAPKFPSGISPPEESGTRREQLAIWMASRDNPYLARAAVNRTWAHLFGRGLVDPVDDLGGHNVPSHPELLDELTHYFVETGFDLRELYRTLTATRAYQLTSRWSGGTEPPAELFARMQLKPLTPEQWYDSLARLFGTPETIGMPGLPAVGPFAARRLSFIGRMQSPSRQSIDYQAGVLQALTLLNGSDVQAASGAEQSSLVGALASPLFSEWERLEIIFLATLARRPTDDERQLGYDYLHNGGPAKDPKQAASDLVWAILNGAEFALNH